MSSTMVVDGIPIEVTRKNVKNISLRVRSADAKVVVTAPYWVDDLQIRFFVAANAVQIRKKLAAAQAVQNEIPEAGEQGAFVLWGKRYPLRTREGKAFSLTVTDTEAVFTEKRGATKDQRDRFVREWYRKELTRVAGELLPLWEQHTGLYCREWRTKYMTSRWGTCNTRDKRVWLNVELAKHPMKCLEYVILHELAHLQVAGHGPAFRAILDRYMPDWRKRKKLLG